MVTNEMVPDQEPNSTDDAQMVSGNSTPLTPPTPPDESDLLADFDPDDYKKGVSGDERYRILDLYLGYLCSTDIKYDQVKIRGILARWDEKNHPPLGFYVIKDYVKANSTRWLQYHHRRNYPSKR